VEALAASGLLYRTFAVACAIGRPLSHAEDPSFYYHLGTTAYEIAIAMVIGGLSGMAVGISSRQQVHVARLRAYLYYSRSVPEDHLFPIMIMWFGVDGLEDRDGAISASSRSRSNVAGECARSTSADPSARASAQYLQMVTKIYLPAMRHPLINGIRLRTGRALIARSWRRPSSRTAASDSW